MNSTSAGTTRAWGLRMAAIAAMCLALPGCGGLAKALGLTKSSPDEFAIVTKAPLVIPPDFSLRPPRPGAQRPQELQPGTSAAAVLFTDFTDQREFGQDQTQGERSLLSKAGALQADNSIRRVLEAETTLLARKDRSFADQILFWQGETDTVETLAGGTRETETVRESRKETGIQAEASLSQWDRRQGWF